MAAITYLMACYQAQVLAYINDMLGTALSHQDAARQFKLLHAILVELGL